MATSPSIHRGYPSFGMKSTGGQTIGAAIHGNLSSTSITSPTLAALQVQNNSDVKFKIFAEENGQNIEMLFTPEVNISAIEHVRLTMLFIAMATGAMLNPVEPLLFVRLHNLERHFTFSTP